ncbi:MAG: radical SAM protein [Candidatus Micrarchaeia archaeon]
MIDGRTLIFDWATGKSGFEEDGFCASRSCVRALESRRIQYFLIPSYSCNLNCSYCFQRKSALSRKKSGRRVLDFFFEEVDREVERSEGVSPSISLFGGEPLVLSNKEYVVRFMEEVEKRNLSFRIYTNGLGLGDYLEDLLVFKKNLEHVHVTFDGGINVHDCRRGKGVYDKVLRNIQQASPALNFVLRINVDNENVRGIETLLEDVSGVSNVAAYFAPVREDLCAKGLTNGRVLGNRFLFEVLKYSKKYDVGLKGFLGVEEGKAAALGEKVVAKHCFCVKKRVFDPFGFVYPCICTAGYPDFACRKEFNFEKVTSDWWADFNSFKKEPCNLCQWFFACGGGCNLEWKTGKVTRCANELEQNLIAAYKFYSS